jgi:hypothetical protein
MSSSTQQTLFLLYFTPGVLFAVYENANMRIRLTLMNQTRLGGLGYGTNLKPARRLVLSPDVLFCSLFGQMLFHVLLLFFLIFIMTYYGGI